MEMYVKKNTVDFKKLKTTVYREPQKYDWKNNRGKRLPLSIDSSFRTSDWSSEKINKSDWILQSWVNKSNNVRKSDPI